VHPQVEAGGIVPDTIDECGPNESGVLVTRGYDAMKGYHDSRRETDNTMGKDGGLWRGGLATAEENGCVRIRGRNKDMIIRGGEHIHPREIEEFLYRHQGILDVQVVGVPDKKYGAEIMAWIILKPGIVVTDTDIRDYCLGQISYHKIPKYIE